MYGPGTLKETSTRRSIYFTVKRSQLIPMLQVFDWPDALQGMGVRPTTTIAPQALYLMNDPQVRSGGGLGSACRSKRRGPGRHRTGSLSVVPGRDPKTEEQADALAFVARHRPSRHRRSVTQRER